jgi:hypothetical protein
LDAGDRCPATLGHIVNGLIVKGVAFWVFIVSVSRLNFASGYRSLPALVEQSLEILGIPPSLPVSDNPMNLIIRAKSAMNSVGNT